MADPRRIRRGVFVLFGWDRGQGGAKTGPRWGRGEGESGVGSGRVGADSWGFQGGIGVDVRRGGGAEAAVGVGELGVRWGRGVPLGVVCG